MTLYDYDLVVLGNTVAGRAAAVQAARLRARVALVDTDQGRELRSQDAHRRLLRLSQGALQNDPQWHPEVVFRQAQGQSGPQNLGLEDLGGQAALAQVGVDEIDGEARFLDRHRLRVNARWATASDPGRTLVSRRFLLALPGVPHIPQGVLEWDGPVGEGVPWETVPWETVLSWVNWPELPETVVILGQDSWGLELAQALRRLGCGVVVLTQAVGVLPERDGVLGACIQAQLEAEGVEVVTRVEKVWMESGSGGRVLHWNRVEMERSGEVRRPRTSESALANRQILLDQRSRLVLATGWRVDLSPLHWERLHLGGGLGGEESLGTLDPSEKSSSRAPSGQSLGAIAVNAHLQTRLPHLYGCGVALGGAHQEAIALAEARYAVRHALWGWGWSLGRLAPPSSEGSRGIDYRAIPWVLYTDPPAWRLGRWPLPGEMEGWQVSECFLDEGLLRWGTNWEINWGTNWGTNLGAGGGRLLRVLSRGRGPIVAAQGWGDGALAWLGPLSLAIQQGLGLAQLAELPCIGGVEDAIAIAAQAGLWQRLAANPWWEDRLERFFNFRRTGNV